MKKLIHTAAALSFTLFFISGAIVIAQPGLFATVVGLFLMGIAVFAGAHLWLAAEKQASKSNGH